MRKDNRKEQKEKGYYGIKQTTSIKIIIHRKGLL